MSRPYSGTTSPSRLRSGSLVRSPIVTVSATPDADWGDELYNYGIVIGYLCAKYQLTVLTGGERGVMEAVSLGVQLGGSTSIGMLSGEKAASANPYVDLAIATGLGDNRQALLSEVPDAMIVIGDAAGSAIETDLMLKRRDFVFRWPAPLPDARYPRSDQFLHLAEQFWYFIRSIDRNTPRKLQVEEQVPLPGDVHARGVAEAAAAVDYMDVGSAERVSRRAPIVQVDGSNLSEFELRLAQDVGRLLAERQAVLLATGDSRELQGGAVRPAIASNTLAGGRNIVFLQEQSGLWDIATPEAQARFPRFGIPAMIPHDTDIGARVVLPGFGVQRVTVAGYAAGALIVIGSLDDSRAEVGIAKKRGNEIVQVCDPARGLSSDLQVATAEIAVDRALAGRTMGR